MNAVVTAAVAGAQLAGYAGIAVAVALLIGAMLVAVRGPGLRGWLLLWLTLACFGAGVVAPLWRLTGPEPLQVREVLTRDQRDVTLPDAPRDATYRLEVAAAGGASAASGGYVLLARLGETTQTIEGRFGGESSIFEVDLERGEALRLFLERGDGSIVVRVAEQPVWSRWFDLLAILAALVAVIADRACTTRRWRGLLTTAVASASVYSLAVTRPADHTGKILLGTTVIALLAGGAFAVVTQLLVGLLGPRETREAPATGRARSRPPR